MEVVRSTHAQGDGVFNFSEEEEFTPYSMERAERVQAQLNDLLYEAKNAYALANELGLGDSAREAYMRVFRNQLSELLEEFHEACVLDTGRGKRSG